MNKIEKILDAIDKDLLPLTRRGVLAGNHVFGGLVLDARTLDTVTAGTNNRCVNPIYHGEIDTIMRFFALKDRPKPEDCLFVASHEPCSMCASAIAWAGFREVWVLFGAETMTGDFDMPVDMKMYRDIFGVSGVKEVNSFYRKYELKREAAQTPEAAALAGKISHLEEEYGRLEVKDFQYPGM